jgi:hypothetical protein
MRQQIQHLERGGFDQEELRTVRRNYLDVMRIVGLQVQNRIIKRGKPSLTEVEDSAMQGTLIFELRQWYQALTLDPNLSGQDILEIPETWERQLRYFRGRLNRLYQTLLQPGAAETQLDNMVKEINTWMLSYFKNYTHDWQGPLVQIEDVTNSSTSFIVRFYVDDIRAEWAQRGRRVNSEVRRELNRVLREAYLM